MDDKLKALTVEFRRYALHFCKQLQVAFEEADDAVQDGIAEYLASGDKKEANAAVVRHIGDIASARSRNLSLDEKPTADSDEYVDLLPTLSHESSFTAPTDPAERMAVVVAARNAKPYVGRKKEHFRARVTVLGKELLCGSAPTRAEAMQQAKRFLKALEESCIPIIPKPEDDDIAARFILLCSQQRALPSFLCGDPLDTLLFLEDFANRVKPGSIYYPEKRDWYTKRKAA